jgi:hypothetical protein
MMPELYDLVTTGYVKQCNKHGLAPNAGDYAEAQVNEMTNSELLRAISDALLCFCSPS